MIGLTRFENVFKFAAAWPVTAIFHGIVLCAYFGALDIYTKGVSKFNEGCLVHFEIKKTNK